MAKSSIASAPLLVAAIDFGTTYSGYAFSMRDDPLKVQTNHNWVAGSETLISLKTPTCVLVDRSGKFHSFGYEAENKYTSLAEDDEHHGWCLFRRFKMLLHNNKTLSRASTVEDMNGDSMQAFPIFTMAIRFLKDHLIETLSKQAIGIEETDIKYVLTVPAIWDDDAKQFMREAAVEAGIDTDRLKLALEPEAASIWCEKINPEAKLALAGAGTQYMVVDLGGGTADISVHEKKSDGTLKEIHRASGGPWGGIYVDENYLQTMTDIFGDKAMAELKTEEMKDYFDMLREFETKKRTFSLTMKDKVTFRTSTALRELSEKHYGKNLKDRLDTLSYGDSVILKGRDKLRIDPSVVQQWFKSPVDRVIKHIKELLAEPRMRTVQTIILVGGFGESQYVQERFHNEIQNKRLIVPEQPGLVVLKGAVRYGHNSGIVSSRIMRYCYGLQSTSTFDAAKHPSSAKVNMYGREMVIGTFSAFVKIDDEIRIDQEVTRTGHRGRQETAYQACIFRTTDPNTIFTTDSGCEKLGKISLKTFGAADTIDITLIFGDSELMVKAREQKTGKENYLRIDCLK